MLILIKYILKSLFLPPGLFLLLIMIAGILRLKRKRALSYLIALCSILGLYFVSTPRGAYFFTAPLEENIKPLANEKLEAEAIVILGAGQKTFAPEYEAKSTASTRTLVRLAYGAVLFRRTALPILLSGGAGLDDEDSEAKVMARALRDIFSVPSKWMEEKSRNTRENASLSGEMLKNAGIRRILLVTEAWHMRRALLSFKSTGLDVVPAPTNFISRPREGAILTWLPNAEAMAISSRSLHEWIGYIWYRVVIP